MHKIYYVQCTKHKVYHVKCTKYTMYNAQSIKYTIYNTQNMPCTIHKIYHPQRTLDKTITELHIHGLLVLLGQSAECCIAWFSGHLFTLRAVHVWMVGCYGRVMQLIIHNAVLSWVRHGSEVVRPDIKP